MYSTSNQDIVEVQKEKCDTDNIYAKINIDAMRLAMKDLTPVEFQVWLYFAKNQAGYVFAVSPAAALDEFGIKKQSFQDAKRKLKAKGYLIENLAKGNNHWIFREKPVEDIMYVEKV